MVSSLEFRFIAMSARSRFNIELVAHICCRELDWTGLLHEIFVLLFYFSVCCFSVPHSMFLDYTCIHRFLTSYNHDLEKERSISLVHFFPSAFLLVHSSRGIVAFHACIQLLCHYAFLLLSFYLLLHEWLSPLTLSCFHFSWSGRSSVYHDSIISRGLISRAPLGSLHADLYHLMPLAKVQTSHRLFERGP